MSNKNQIHRVQAHQHQGELKWIKGLINMEIPMIKVI